MNINLTFINSTFTNLEKLDRSDWILSGKVISAGSVLINALAIFLIVTKSKKEKRAYKMALVTSQSLLCISQFQFGVLLCVIPLFPFPAFKFYGILGCYIDVVLLLQTYIVAITSFLWALYATLVIRFRMVVRADSFFNFSARTWIAVSLSLYTTCLMVFSVLLEILRLPADVIENFIAWKYPKYKDFTKDTGLLVVIDKQTLHITSFCSIALVGLLITLYVTLSVMIYVEVRHKVNSMSAALRNYHMKVLKDIVLQIIIKLVTFTFYPTLTVLLYFVTPEFDCITLTMVLYNVFVCAPIPGTVMLIAQTPSYRQSVLNALLTVQRIDPLFVPNQRTPTYTVIVSQKQTA